LYRFYKQITTKGDSMNFEKRAILVILASLFICTAALADGGVYWQENGVLVCDSTFGGGLSPFGISPDNEGGAIIVWHDERLPFGDGIACQRIDSLGNTLWDEEGVFIDSVAFWLPHPRVISDGSGGAIITWMHTEFPCQSVYAQRVNSAGVPLWGYPGIDVGVTDSVQTGQAIISDGYGGCIIVWGDWRNGNYDTYAQRINPSGVRLWGPSGIPICTESHYQGYNNIVKLSDTCIIVVWSDLRNGNDYDVYGQRIDINGTPMWTANGVVIDSAAGDQYVRAMERSSQDRVILVWENGDYISDDFDIYAQCVDSDGDICWDTGGVAICEEDSLEYHTKIVSDGKGGIVAVWLDERTSIRWDVYAQRVDSSGVCVWDSNGVFINTIADTSQEPITLYPRLCTDGRSGGIITWKDYRADNWDIYCQRIDSSGILQWGIGGLPVCITSDEQDWGPVICDDGKDGAIIAWGDRRFYASVYAQRVGDVVGAEERKDIRHETKDIRLTASPNPFVERIEIRLHCESVNGWIGESVIQVFDVTGREVRQISLLPFSFSLGAKATWDGRDGDGQIVNDGIYFIRVETDNEVCSEKIVKITYEE
jgi:hypothetical protein